MFLSEAPQSTGTNVRSRVPLRTASRIMASGIGLPSRNSSVRASARFWSEIEVS